MKAWKVITDLTVEENDFIDELISDEDGDIIKSLDANGEIYSFDELSEEGYIITYMICTQEVMDALAELCEKYHIQFEPSDITEDILMGLTQIPDSDFTRFREDNLDEDMVYKKIKTFGVQFLDEIDKRVLDESI